MYRLSVYLPGQRASVHTVEIRTASEVMKTIPKLLAEHPGCECIEVRLSETLLFAVDCKGRRVTRRG